MTELRRRDDDPIYERLSRLETQVGAMETKVNTLSLEQGHMLKLFDARFSTVEKSQELALSELRGVRQSITEMGSEAEKSPAGRSMLKSIDELSVQNTKYEENFRILFRWKDGVEGSFGLLRFVGFGSLVTGGAALIWVALRAMGQVP